ncbi:MAG: monofunctional biosynthetic peptidoglycan transglycosylase [Nitrospirota bacterium]
MFFVFISLFAGLTLYLFLVPDVSKLKKQNPKKTSFMEYREEEWRRQGKKYRIQQKWVPLSQIAPYLIKAVLISEDDKFWSHEGFDYEAIQKAIEKDIKTKKFKLGGSTISQQLAKNLYLSPAKNPIRKIREAIITWRLERVLTKKRILELYLNVVEWGDRGIFGIGVASRHYYGKLASELNPEEASRLASVLPNPRRYNPLGDSRYVTHRSNLIYSIMVRRGIVVPEYEEVAEGEEKNGQLETPPETPIKPGEPQTQ